MPDMRLACLVPNVGLPQGITATFGSAFQGGVRVSTKTAIGRTKMHRLGIHDSVCNFKRQLDIRRR